MCIRDRNSPAQQRNASASEATLCSPKAKISSSVTAMTPSVMAAMRSLSLIHIYGDFGYSLQAGLAVSSLIASNLPDTLSPVSYTHLDVYKRQAQGRSSSSPAASRRETIRLTLDFSSPRNGTSCAAVISPLIDTSSRVCTAEGE